MNTREAAEYLGLKEITLRGYVAHGIGPEHSFEGSHPVYTMHDLDAYKISRQTRASRTVPLQPKVNITHFEFPAGLLGWPNGKYIDTPQLDFAAPRCICRASADDEF